MNNCQRDYGIANYNQICSNHGTCMMNSCYCDDGWTGIADSQLTPGVDCDINILVLQVIGSLNIVIGTVAIFVCLRYLRYRMISNSSKSTEFFDPNFYAPFSLLLSSLSIFVFGMIKLIDPIRYVIGGSTWIASCCIGFLIPTCCVGLALYVLILIRFLNGFIRVMRDNTRILYEKRVLFVKNINIIFAFLSIIVGFVIISESLFSNFADFISIFTIFTVFFLLALANVLILFILVTMTQELSFYLDNTRSVDTSAIQIVYTKLMLFQRFMIFLLINCLPPNLLFPFWYYLRRKYTYCVAIQTSMLGLSIIFGVLAISKDNLQTSNTTVIPIMLYNRDHPNANHLLTIDSHFPVNAANGLPRQQMNTKQSHLIAIQFMTNDGYKEIDEMRDIEESNQLS